MMDKLKDEVPLQEKKNLETKIPQNSENLVMTVWVYDQDWDENIHEEDMEMDRRINTRLYQQAVEALNTNGIQFKSSTDEAMGTYQIWVADKDVEQARKLLERTWGPDPRKRHE
jgi:hypothetical protein